MSAATKLQHTALVQAFIQLMDDHEDVCRQLLETVACFSENLDGVHAANVECLRILREFLIKQIDAVGVVNVELGDTFTCALKSEKERKEALSFRPTPEQIKNGARLYERYAEEHRISHAAGKEPVS